VRLKDGKSVPPQKEAWALRRFAVTDGECESLQLVQFGVVTIV
jgi:hypothetical protein